MFQNVNTTVVYFYADLFYELIFVYSTVLYARILIQLIHNCISICFAEINALFMKLWLKSCVFQIPTSYQSPGGSYYWRFGLQWVRIPDTILYYVYLTLIEFVIFPGMVDIQYTEQGLLEQLETCTSYVDKAERYELLGPFYRLILPFYEKQRNFESLTRCYRHLDTAYTKVLDIRNTGRRLLGRYYRVAFFNQVYFEDECGIEYIYKEPKVTSLSEISERLFKLYEQKFGVGVVKTVMDSAPVITI